MSLNIGVSGHFNLRVHDGKGNTLRELEFENLILDAGLNRAGIGPIGTRCHVGTGSTAPSVSQTSLVAKLADTSQVLSSTNSAQPTAPYYFSAIRTFRFNEGAAAGNLTEIGIGWSADFLFCRALILDGDGDPTTLTVLSNEFLDVTYTLRMYSNLTDVLVEDMDIGGVLTDVTIRAGAVARAIPNAAEHIFSAYGFAVAENTSGSAQFTGFNGAIGPITGDPSGLNAGFPGAALQPYESNSYRARWILFADLGNLNLEGGIRSIMLPAITGRYQMEFNPPIEKTNERRLSLTVSVSWSRRS